MTTSAVGIDDVRARTHAFPAAHFTSVLDLNRLQALDLLDLAGAFVALNRQAAKKLDLLKGRTLMNLFFENSTRTQSSFELAGKRLGADVVMMLRLQLERMQGALVPSTREYFRFYGLDREKLAVAPKAKVMHPGPMNRGVEIDSEVADDPAVSLIQNQVEMGVAVRMAVLASLAARLDASLDPA